MRLGIFPFFRIAKKNWHGHFVDTELLLHILTALDVAILRRTAPRQYVFLGDAPPFYTQLFPSTANGPCTTPWQHSEFLAFFLADVEKFFTHAQKGRITSGTWQEAGIEDEKALCAEAMEYKGTQVLIIRRLSEDYVERSRTLQKARDSLLKHRVRS